MLQIVETGTREAADFLSKLMARGKLTDESIFKTVRRTLSDVQAEGDKAVVRYTRKLDAPRISVKELKVSREEFGEAYLEVPSEFIDAITHARTNIEKFHQKQLRTSWMSTEPNGVLLGHLIRPLRRVGVHVPAVSQLLVSSLLMNVIPATVAGVEEIAVCIPPMRNREINPYMLVAAAECGIQEIYKCGGAQAVAALAYGTKTIPPVDKIVGPGNLYVQFAKKEVYGHVDIDKLAGPSEILVIADSTADPDYVAADLISQAEHKADSAAILITPSLGFAEQVIISDRGSGGILTAPRRTHGGNLRTSVRRLSPPIYPRRSPSPMKSHRSTLNSTLKTHWIGSGTCITPVPSSSVPIRRKPLGITLRVRTMSCLQERLRAMRRPSALTIS